MIRKRLKRGYRTAPAASAAVFTPADLNLSGWWRGSYGGLPWAATASAGVSATTGSLVAGIAPDVGSAVNGYTPAELVAANTDYMQNATDALTLLTKAAGTIICLFNADIANVHSTTDGGRLDAPLYRESNDTCIFSFADNGVSIGVYQSGYKWATKACSTGAWHLAMARWNSSVVGITLDSEAEVTTVCGLLTVLTGTMYCGYGYGGTNKFDGKIMELMMSPTALTNTDYGNIKSYVNSRYALAL